MLTSRWRQMRKAMAVKVLSETSPGDLEMRIQDLEQEQVLLSLVIERSFDKKVNHRVSGTETGYAAPRRCR